MTLLDDRALQFFPQLKYPWFVLHCSCAIYSVLLIIINYFPMQCILPVSPNFSCLSGDPAWFSMFSLLTSRFGRRNITCMHGLLGGGEDIEGQFGSVFLPFLRWACVASMFSIFRDISPNEDGWALSMTVAHLFREVHHLFGDRPPALRRSLSKFEKERQFCRPPIFSLFRRFNWIFSTDANEGMAVYMQDHARDVVFTQRAPLTTI